MNEATAPEAEGQAAAAAPEAQGQATQEAANQASWYDGADEATVGYIKNKGWDASPLKAVEGYQNLEKYHGVSPDKILKLPEDMSAEGAMDEVYNKLGRPESADKYELSFPEGIPVDNERLGELTKVAHAVGLNQQQLAALAEADAKYLGGLLQADAAKQQAEIEQLQSEWGDGFSEREELARRFVRSNLPDGVDKEALLTQIEGAIGTANMLKMFANAGDKFREHKMPDSSGDRPYGYTKEQAISDKQQLMAEIKADPERLANYNSGKGTDIDKINNLNKIISG